MATLSKASPSKPSTQLSKSSQNSEPERKLAEIVKQLAKLAVRRQAKLEPSDFWVLAEDLAVFELPDIHNGLEELGRTERKEGETAFPALGTMLRAIRDYRARQQAKEREERMRQEAEDYGRDIKLNPDKYVSIAEMVKMLTQHKGMKP